MSRKRANPFEPASEVIRLLSSLTHDELRDLADMLTADDEPDPRRIPPRYGIPPLDPDNEHRLILYGGWQYREKPALYTEPARQELRVAYFSAKKQLTPEARALVIQVARQLQRALAPVAERRRSPSGKPLASGSIQTKFIYRKILNLDTGQIERRAFGPYLYYRFWVSGGDNDRRGKRLKNKYIGLQPLAIIFNRTEPGSDERRILEGQIIAAMNAGTLETLLQELGLEAADSIDELGDSSIIPNPPITENQDTPAAAPVFLPGYQPAKTRKQTPPIFALTEIRREVLAAYAAGLNYPADYAEGIQKRKIARVLAEAGLLAEITGRTNHREHRWKLTESGLKLVRRDADLQRRIAEISEPDTRLIGYES